MLSQSNRAAIQILSAVLKQPQAKLPKVPQRERAPVHFICLIRQKEPRKVFGVRAADKRDILRMGIKMRPSVCFQVKGLERLGKR